MNNQTTPSATTSDDVDELFVRAANAKDFRALGAALAAGANIDVANVRGITPLHAAVMARNEELVRWLVKSGANPSLRTSAGDSALHDAAKNEAPEMLRHLLAAKGVNVDVDNSMRTTPLMEAAGAIRRENLKMLLAAGASVSHKSKQGSSALLISSAKHDHESVRALLAKGANPNDADSYGVSALISAAAVMARYETPEEESQEVMSQKTLRELVGAGANVNAVAKSGNTALAEASRCMNRRGMLLLIEAGANPNVHSTAGVSGEMTPLMVAAYKHDMELMEKMLARQADVNFTNNKGQTAIAMAMMAPVQNEKQQEKAKATIEALLKAGAKLQQGTGGKNAMGLAHYAVVTENRELLEVAKAQGVLEQPGESGATAIFYATAMRKAEMIKALKELGANFNATNALGQNALHLLAAAPYPAQVRQAVMLMRQRDDEKLKGEADRVEAETKKAALEFTEMLVGYGVNINAADKKGNTPLHGALDSLASELADPAYIDYLLSKGADISIRNEDEESCFVKVVKHGNEALSEAWAKRLIAEGKAEEVAMIVYDLAWVALDMEAQVAATKRVFEKLLPLGARLDYQDEDGNFPLLVAATQNKEDLVVALLDLGADIAQTNNEGEVAAFHTIKENRANITQILFERGTNPDAMRNDGESLITIAYREHRATAVQQIVEFRPVWKALQEARELAAEAPVPTKKPGM